MKNYPPRYYYNYHIEHIVATFRKTGLWLLFLLFLGINAKAQTPFFSPVNVSPEALNLQQKAIYDKAVNIGTYKSFQIVQVNPISSSIYADSLLRIELTGLACHSSAQFATRNIEYQTDNDFYWYGEYIYNDSASDCYRGEAMFFTDSGKRLGFFTINKQHYELIDLSGGLHLLAEADPAKAGTMTCGTTGEVVGNKSTGSTENEMCEPVVVLTLMTQDAVNQDPLGTGRATMAFNQTQQALWNSGVYRLRLKHKVQVVNYTVPTWQNLPNHQSKVKAVKDFIKYSTYNSPIRNIVLNARIANKADIVMLLIPGDHLDDVAGIANDTVVQSNQVSFAVVQTFWATEAGYTYAHELGHCIGAVHSNEGQDGDYSNNNIAHAHSWSFSTYTGWWIFRKEHINDRKTIVYQNTVGNSDVILKYSNPQITDNGYPTGRVNDRDAAKKFNAIACIAAQYNTAPDDFGAWITGNSLTTFPYKIHCKNVVLNAYQYGYPGPYSYSWQYSSNGINYTNIGNASSLNLILQPGSYYFRLTVTAAGGYTATVYYRAFVANCEFRLAPPTPSHNYSIVNSEAVSTGSLLVNTALSSDGQLVIKELDPKESYQEVGLYDMLGKCLIKAKVVSNTQNVTLNVSDIARGIYVLRVQQNGRKPQSQLISIFK